MRPKRGTEVRFPGPAGRLEGRIEAPETRSEAELRGVAVVCHPHPMHGGTMDNSIVVRTARALRSAGLVSLRFNFCGTENSEGRHDGTGAEEGDVLAAIDELARRHPDLPVWAAGYSFGARTVAGLALREPRIQRLVLVAYPLEVYDGSGLADLVQPGLLLFGSADEFGTAATLRRQVPTPPSNLRVEEIPDADHFFRGCTPDVEARIRAFAQNAFEDRS